MTDLWGNSLEAVYDSETFRWSYVVRDTNNVVKWTHKHYQSALCKIFHKDYKALYKNVILQIGTNTYNAG
jgi:hypothetical protein